MTKNSHTHMLAVPGGTETGRRNLILAVAYEADATDAQRSLGWLAPKLVDADLTMTEDTLRLRKWAGVIDGEVYARFADSWGIDPHLTAYGHTWDGMEWESGGASPIVWASLTVDALHPGEPLFL